MIRILHLFKKTVTSVGSNLPWQLMPNVIFHLKLEKETWGFLRLDLAPEMKKQMGRIFSEVPARLTPSYTIWRNIITCSTSGKGSNSCFVCIQEAACICFSTRLALSLLTQACYPYFSCSMYFQVIPSINIHYLSMKQCCMVRLCLCCARVQISALGETSVQVSSCNCHIPAFILLLSALL